MNYSELGPLDISAISLEQRPIHLKVSNFQTSYTENIKAQFVFPHWYVKRWKWHYSSMVNWKNIRENFIVKQISVKQHIILKTLLQIQTDKQKLYIKRVWEKSTATLWLPGRIAAQHTQNMLVHFTTRYRGSWSTYTNWLDHSGAGGGGGGGGGLTNLNISWR